MDRAKKEVLVSILMDSPLYLTMPLEERVSLLSRLENDYPSLFTGGQHEDDSGGSLT